nr:phosphoribosyltransferase family protein [uncultured Oscillibacter sp.]
MSLLEGFLNLLFPPKCPFCGKVQDHAGICPACEKALPWTDAPHTIKEGPGGLRCAAPLWYEDQVREGLLRFKFQGAAGAAVPLGELIARCAAEQFSGAFDIVTWVPVSKKRLRKRGYDQAKLLAEEACRLWDTEPVQLLRKITDNPAQSGIHDAAARRANVLGVYEAARPEQIRGHRVLLIDDICTTGATLTECVRVLRDAGAEDVVCAAVAHTREQKRQKTENI